MKDWLIKKLGGYTQQTVEKIQSNTAKQEYAKGFADGSKRKRNTPSWMKQEIHNRLNMLFPGKEFDKSRFRWLKEHSRSSVHMSEMSYEELKSINQELGKLLGEK